MFSFYRNSKQKSERASKLAAVSTWWCYYGADSGVLSTGYDMYVLEPDAIGDLDVEKKKGALCLAYLSIGELDAGRDSSQSLLDEDFIIEPNPDWEGALLVDIRSAKWHQFVLKSARDRLECGYDGFFLDTIDTVETLLNKDPVMFKDIGKRAVALVKSIRKKNPAAIIISNGGGSLAEELSPYIDAWCIESVEHTYDFQKKIYSRHDEDSQQWIDMRIRTLKDTGLPVFALDYSDNAESLKVITSLLRARALIPSASSIDLQQLPPE